MKNVHTERNTFRGGFFLFVVLICAVISGESAHAYWVWTPETGKWINPRYSAKETDKEQFDWAQEFFDAGDYKRAISEFRKLVRYYRNSPLAGEGQYGIGLAYERLKDYYRAYLAYKKLVEKFPESDRIKEAIAAEYRIGTIYLGEEGEKEDEGKKVFKPAAAVNIFREVVKQGPFGEYGDKAQYHLGVALVKCGRYRKAKDEFETLLKEYPETPLIDNGRYYLALCWQKISPGAQYDQDSAIKAIEQFNQVVESNPEEEKVEVAKKALEALNEERAENTYKIARFYEIQKKRFAAAAYYREVVENYPETSWAVSARERLEALKVDEREKTEKGSSDTGEN